MKRFCEDCGHLEEVSMFAFASGEEWLCAECHDADHNKSRINAIFVADMKEEQRCNDVEQERIEAMDND